MRSRGRRGVAVTVETTITLVNVNASSSMVGVLIDGVLHFAQDVIDVDEVFLGARAGHGEVILLSEGVLAR